MEASEDIAELELSVVLPCLDEAETLGTCIAKAQGALRSARIHGEIIVADNGSKDGSRQIAQRMGARVVEVAERGYGSALMGGIAAARGRYVVMADADDSYDLGDVGRFVELLRAGHELVQGCRLPAGGGVIEPGAMPLLHERLGNPALTFLSRRWFKVPVHDVYCGMRGFTKELYQRLDQRCTGMEFAMEMIVKSSLVGARIAELPITLKPDGRVAQTSHLRTFRDGFRSLSFLLMYAPRWLYLVPGLSGLFVGLVGYAVVMPGARIGRVNLDAHTLLFASLAVLCGYQAVLFAVLTKVFAVAAHLIPGAREAEWQRSWLSLPRGLAASGLAMALGLSLLIAAILEWKRVSFGDLDYAHTMRLVIPGATLTALGFQTFLASFFIAILRLARR